MNIIKTYEELNFEKVKRKFKKKFGNYSESDRFIDKAIEYPNSKYYINDNGDLTITVSLNKAIISNISFLFLFRENISPMITLRFQGDYDRQLYKYLSFIKKDAIPLSSFDIQSNYDILYSYSGFGGESFHLSGINALEYDSDVIQFIKDICNIDYDKIFSKIEENSKKVFSEENIIDDIKDFFIEIEDMYGIPRIESGKVKDSIIIELYYNITGIRHDDYIDTEDEQLFKIHSVLKSARSKIKSISDIVRFVYKLKNQELLIRIELKLK